MAGMTDGLGGVHANWPHTHRHMHLQEFQAQKLSASGQEIGGDLVFGKRMGFSGTPRWGGMTHVHVHVRVNVFMCVDLCSCVARSVCGWQVAWLVGLAHVGGWVWGGTSVCVGLVCWGVCVWLGR